MITERMRLMEAGLTAKSGFPSGFRSDYSNEGGLIPNKDIIKAVNDAIDEMFYLEDPHRYNDDEIKLSIEKNHIRSFKFLKTSGGAVLCQGVAKNKKKIDFTVNHSAKKRSGGIAMVYYIEIITNLEIWDD